MRVLVSWLGFADLAASQGQVGSGLGPVGQAIAAGTYNEIVLLNDHVSERAEGYQQWVRGKTSVPVVLFHENLSSPTDFAEIYEAAVRAVTQVLQRNGPDTELTYHLSPGTPAMAAVWMLLAKSRFPAQLLESSKQHGVKAVNIPFDIAAEFLPDLLRRRDAALNQLAADRPADAPEFSEIVHRSEPMKRLIARARLVAARSVPVMIEGESGTGKELLARAIHASSPRAHRPFVAVNCGAIPANLVEAELFGHEKGAFTGAVRSRLGYFRTADGGTLFLDEIGELASDLQVKLLRTLEESEVVPVGASTPVRVDVRIIAATNRKLMEDVAGGAFRVDLFYRLAVAIFRVPPVRERGGDVGMLIDHLLGRVNSESARETGYRQRRLAPGARAMLLRHEWPGNVREMLNTLRRATIWASGDTVEAEDVRDALLSGGLRSNDVLGRPLGNGFRLQDVVGEVARHYLQRAVDEAGGNKGRAASLIGLTSHQTLSNWLRRFGSEGPKAG